MAEKKETPPTWTQEPGITPAERRGAQNLARKLRQADERTINETLAGAAARKNQTEGSL